VWFGNQVLKAAFPYLFSLAHCKDASLTGYLKFLKDSY